MLRYKLFLRLLFLFCFPSISCGFFARVRMHFCFGFGHLENMPEYSFSFSGSFSIAFPSSLFVRITEKKIQFFHSKILMLASIIKFVCFSGRETKVLFLFSVFFCFILFSYRFVAGFGARLSMHRSHLFLVEEKWTDKFRLCRPKQTHRSDSRDIFQFEWSYFLLHKPRLDDEKNFILFYLYELIIMSDKKYHL